MKNCNFLFIFYYIFISFGMLSCNMNNHNIFNGTEIENITYHLPLLNMQDSSFFKGIRIHEQIMVHYFNGNCSSCIVGIVEHEGYAEAFSNDNHLGLLFITRSNTDTAVLNFYLIDKMHFKHPVLYDEQNLFHKWNRTYLDKGINTFLINNSGKVLVAGDPLLSEDVDNQYRKKLGRND